MIADFLEPTVLAAAVSAIFVFLASFLKARYGREGSHFTRLENLLEKQEKRISALEEDVECFREKNSSMTLKWLESEEYIGLLKRHIQEGKPPPPPERE